MVTEGKLVYMFVKPYGNWYELIYCYINLNNDLSNVARTFRTINEVNLHIEYVLRFFREDYKYRRHKT